MSMKDARVTERCGVRQRFHGDRWRRAWRFPRRLVPVPDRG
jgi:hypothetical protein